MSTIEQRFNVIQDLEELFGELKAKLKAKLDKLGG